MQFLILTISYWCPERQDVHVWLGRRPRTRPVAMNPVDHPMGGGEGKSSGGHPRSRNGIPAKGFRTRSKTKSSNKFIIERRKK